MANDIFQKISIELDKQINEKLSTMSELEIKKAENLYKKKVLKTALVLSLLLCPFPIIIAILLPNLISSNSNLAIPSIVMMILISVYIIFEFLPVFRACKNSSQENAYLFLKTQLEKSAENIVEISEQQKNIDTTDFKISKIFDIKNDALKGIKLLVDSENKKFIFQNKDVVCIKPYNFSDILNYEVYENGKSQVQGRAGSALIGGAFFGLGGLIVGSSMSRNINEKCNELKLIIRINDLENPQIVIPYIRTQCDKSGWMYRDAVKNVQELCSLLEYIINSKTLEQSANTQSQINVKEKSPKEQLQELKEMLDDGLITQEDYEQKKKQIIGL